MRSWRYWLGLRLESPGRFRALLGVISRTFGAEYPGYREHMRKIEAECMHDCFASYDLWLLTAPDVYWVYALGERTTQRLGFQIAIGPLCLFFLQESREHELFTAPRWPN
jgi:hypothetical protein